MQAQREAPRARVVVIDDNAAVRGVLCELLELLGLEVHEAATGPEGLRLFAEHACDLIVTDLVMPGMTGWDVVTAARRQIPLPAVVVVSGSATDQDLERARVLEVPFVPKPIQFEDLEGAVEQALRRRSI